MFRSSGTTLLNVKSLSLFALWIFVQVALYIKHGVIIHLEAEKYISSAYQLLNDAVINTKYLSFYSYILFLALIFKLGDGYLSIVIAQIALNLFATIRLFQIAKTLTGKSNIAYLTVLLFIMCYPIQVWNFSLYSESFFLSIAILYFHGLICYDLKQWSAKIKLATLLAILVFARPTAMLYLPGVLAYLLIKPPEQLQKRKSVVVISTSIMMILIFLGAIYFNRIMLFNFMFPNFLAGQIICGVKSNFEGFAPMVDFQSVFINTQLFMKISITKLLYYFGMVRPFYSFGHNLILMLIYPVYLVSLIGFIRFDNKGIKVFASITILSFTSVIIVTCVVWHGRYIVPILPVIILFASIGLDEIWLYTHRKKYVDR